MKKVSFMVLGIAFALSCTRHVDQSPREINFDRDICANCLMGLADQKFSAQSINQRNEVVWFDDLGCLIQYQDSPDWQKFGGDDAVSYIGDSENGGWIEVENAWFVYGNPTPMGYGYSAISHQADTAFTFATTVQRIKDGLNMREEFLKKKKMLHHDTIQ